MIKLFDSDKTTLIATLDNSNIELNPTDRVKKIDSYEVKRFYSHGYYSDLQTFEIVDSNQTNEHRWIKFEDNSYYLGGVMNCFSDGIAAAKFAVAMATGLI